jgi:O-antigen ligase
MPVIQLVCGLAGALVVAGVFLRAGLFGGCLAVLLAGSCFGHPFYFLPAYPIPITADRALMAGLVLQYLVYRRLGLAEPKPMRRADWLLAGLLAVIVLSTFTHDWRYKNNQPVSDVLFQFLMPSALYWVARQSAVTRKHVLWLLGGLAVFGVYLSLTAVCEVQGLSGWVYPRYINDAVRYPEYFGRGRGPFLDPTANGFVLALCLAAAILTWPHLGRRGQLGLMLAMPVYAVGLYSTLTRSVWMGAAAAIVMVAALCVPRAWRWRLVAAAGLIAIVAVSAGWEHLLSFKRDRKVSAQDVADSVQLRPILAMVAWNMFQDRPLLGCGYGQYERQFIYYLADRSSGLPLEKARRYVQHNTFLALLTEVGLVGMALFVSLLWLWTRDAWRLWRRAEVPLWARQVGLLFLAGMAAYVPNAMFHDMLLSPAVTMLLCIPAGALVSLSAATGRRPLQLTTDH